MDKETLSNYGWIVICVLVLAVMLALATPFGKYIETAVKSATQGLFDVNQKALNQTGLITVENQLFEDTGANGSSQDLTLNPDDGTIPQDGDTYEYGNYFYTYYAEDGGWGVRCINNVANPGIILESINGKPITSLYATFANCYYLEVAPTIPSSVVNMNATFQGCTLLKNTPTIPTGVKYLSTTFQECRSLENIDGVVIPDGVKDISYLFADCVSIKNANFVVPDSVTNMYAMFQNCVSLIDASGLVISNNAEDMRATFSGCVNLASMPSLPDSVQNADSMLDICNALTGTISLPCTIYEQVIDDATFPDATFICHHVENCDYSCGLIEPVEGTEPPKLY